MSLLLTPSNSNIVERSFSPEPETARRLLVGLRLAHAAETTVYDDLEDVLGWHSGPQDCEVLAERLGDMLDHLLVRVQVPNLAARCSADAVVRAQTLQAQPPPTDAGIGHLRLLALTVLGLLDHVGDDL
ncbi:DUF6415 family natural product biosynthesis protein [Streptomyces jumonjinensis]|uniref:DUF6415 family natural product biosynthesis protein n=1 Tax=Streptomyces jumonjinensis TaxID=1945 RepID=UPI001294FB07|nr:DUF6415 family natural product biosynthesis protein [Streptomyces jumonjinensis]